MSRLAALLGIFGFFAVPIALLAALVGLVRMRGLGWKLLAMLPILAVGSYFLFVLMPDWERDPTSHNLFPFEIGARFWPAFPYMLALVVMYRSSGRRSPAVR